MALPPRVLPLASLAPATLLPDSHIAGLVTITWPYSPSKSLLSIIVSAEDFRLRRSHGQLRVDFHGPSARDVSKLQLVYGDKVRLALDGASLEELKDASERDVPWVLRYEGKMRMQVQGFGGGETREVVVDEAWEKPVEVDANTDAEMKDQDLVSDEEEEPVIETAPKSPILPSSPPPAAPEAWKTPVRLKHKGGLLYDDTSKTPFFQRGLFDEEEDHEAETGPPRKKMRFSNAFTMVDRSPSPEPVVPRRTTLGDMEQVLSGEMPKKEVEVEKKAVEVNTQASTQYETAREEVTQTQTQRKEPEETQNDESPATLRPETQQSSQPTPRAETQLEDSSSTLRAETLQETQPQRVDAHTRAHPQDQSPRSPEPEKHEAAASPTSTVPDYRSPTPEPAGIPKEVEEYYEPVSFDFALDIESEAEVETPGSFFDEHAGDASVYSISVAATSRHGSIVADDVPDLLEDEGSADGTEETDETEKEHGRPEDEEQDLRRHAKPPRDEAEVRPSLQQPKSRTAKVENHEAPMQRNGTPESTKLRNLAEAASGWSWSEPASVEEETENNLNHVEGQFEDEELENYDEEYDFDMQGEGELFDTGERVDLDEDEDGTDYSEFSERMNYEDDEEGSYDSELGEVEGEEEEEEDAGGASIEDGSRIRREVALGKTAQRQEPEIMIIDSDSDEDEAPVAKAETDEEGSVGDEDASESSDAGSASESESESESEEDEPKVRGQVWEEHQKKVRLGPRKPRRRQAKEESDYEDADDEDDGDEGQDDDDQDLRQEIADVVGDDQDSAEDGLPTHLKRELVKLAKSREVEEETRQKKKIRRASRKKAGEKDSEYKDDGASSSEGSGDEESDAEDLMREVEAINARAANEQEGGKEAGAEATSTDKQPNVETFDDVEIPEPRYEKASQPLAEERPTKEDEAGEPEERATEERSEQDEPDKPAAPSEETAPSSIQLDAKSTAEGPSTAKESAAVPIEEPMDTEMGDHQESSEELSKHGLTIEMPPPPAPASIFRTLREVPGPSAPSLQPLPSPGLPMVSPFLNQSLSGDYIGKLETHFEVDETIEEGAEESVDVTMKESEEIVTGSTELEGSPPALDFATPHAPVDSPEFVDAETSPFAVEEEAVGSEYSTSSASESDEAKNGKKTKKVGSLYSTSSASSSSDEEEAGPSQANEVSGSEKDSLFESEAEPPLKKRTPKFSGRLPPMNTALKSRAAKKPKLDKVPSFDKEAEASAPKTPHLYLPSPSPKLRAVEPTSAPAKMAGKAEEQPKGLFASAKRKLFGTFGGSSRRETIAAPEIARAKERSPSPAIVIQDDEEEAEEFTSGVTTELSDFPAINQLTYGVTSDCIGVVTQRSKVQRAKKGQRDYFLNIRIVDSSSLATDGVGVNIFRPRKIALPTLDVGDVILLRSFKFITEKHKLLGVSTDNSAWAVWKDDGEEAVCEGPPVEYGDAEVEYVDGLGEWYLGLPEDVRERLEGRETREASVEL